MPGKRAGKPAKVCQQGICPVYVPEPFTVVVMIIVYDPGIGSCTLGDMGQQSGTAEQVDEGGLAVELLQGSSEFVHEHALLPHERKRGLVVGLFHFPNLLYFVLILLQACIHTFSSNLTPSSPLMRQTVFSMLFSYICTFPMFRVMDFKGSSICLAIRYR